MNMHIFRRFIFLLSFLLLFSCNKEEPVYQLNQINSLHIMQTRTIEINNAGISILYANPFQTALSSNELVEITNCIESIGDKEVAHEIVLSNFMNSQQVLIPSDSLMRSDLNILLKKPINVFMLEILLRQRESFLLILLNQILTFHQRWFIWHLHSQTNISFTKIFYHEKKKIYQKIANRWSYNNAICSSIRKIICFKWK